MRQTAGENLEKKERIRREIRDANKIALESASKRADPCDVKLDKLNGKLRNKLLIMLHFRWSYITDFKGAAKL